MTNRRPDWPERMWAAIQGHDQDVFGWGTLDCCLFAAEVVDAMTDSKFAKALRARYQDKRSAVQFLKDEGGLEAAVSAYLGPPSPGRALRGDVVLFNTPSGCCLGICVGQQIAAISSVGLLFFPGSMADQRWAV